MNHDAGSPISADLIRTQGRELQGFDLSPARATELAAEVTRIQERMAAVTPGFWFFDEPVQFLTVLDELAAGDE